MDAVSKGIDSIKNRLFRSHDFESALGLKSDDISKRRSLSRNYAPLKIVSEPPCNTFNSGHS